MSTAIYKPGQGYYTRMLSAIGLVAITLMGAAWLWALLGAARFGDMPIVYVKAGGAVLFMAVFGLLGYWLLCVHQRTVEFMIATESEMKKVNWSSKKEIIGSTWVVIGVTVFLALLCFVCDTLFALMFQAMKVLEL